MKIIFSYLKLIRPHQYTKNFFIFLPIFFALQIRNIEKLQFTFQSFFFFSLLASSVYIFNDLLDLKKDKAHPEKSKRPLPSGKIPLVNAALLMVVLSAFSLIMFWKLNSEAFYIALTYLVMNIAYTLKLKEIPIIDIFIIALGFILRIFIGAIVADVPLSHWIILMTFFLAIFLALGKRRDDVLIFEKTGKKMRKVVDGYNMEFINTAMMIMSAIIIVFYAQYTVDEELTKKFNSNYIYLTTIFVVLGLFRYLQLAFVHKQTGNPSKILLKDYFVFSTVLGWVGTLFYLLYLK